MLVSSDAIALRSRKQGDTSKIVTLYSRDFGLVDVIAKGARQLRSKFGSALEPFTCSKIVFYKKEHTDLYLLSAAETISAPRHLTSDLDRIETATHIAELLIKTQRHEESHPGQFDLVCTVLTLLDTNPPEASVALLTAFYLRYAALSGFAIMLDCAEDGSKYYFDADRGEIICTDGLVPISERLILISAGLLTSLRYLQHNPIEKAPSLRLSEEAKNDLRHLFRIFFATHLEGMQQNRTKAGRVFSALK